ncbi:hypothetical protein ACLOJK_038488 [Asimina triloba]
MGVRLTNRIIIVINEDIFWARKSTVGGDRLTRLTRLRAAAAAAPYAKNPRPAPPLAGISHSPAPSTDDAGGGLKQKEFPASKRFSKLPWRVNLLNPVTDT